jgi:23S rRNA (uridine2552-2'-O)-methyltransferase
LSAKRRVEDHFAKRAKKEHFPARSVYKLKEIDEKINLIRRNDKVLDLGAAPGSWTLFAADKVGPNGLVVAVDQQPLNTGTGDNVLYREADVMSLEIDSVLEPLNGARFDAVISDMAPWTSGHRFVDQARSFNLFMRALEIAEQTLRPGGRFVGKIFQGEDFEAARNKMRELFNTVKIIRPKSVRSESYEIYLAGLNRK